MNLEQRLMDENHVPIAYLPRINYVISENIDTDLETGRFVSYDSWDFL